MQIRSCALATIERANERANLTVDPGAFDLDNYSRSEEEGRRAMVLAYRRSKLLWILRNASSDVGGFLYAYLEHGNADFFSETHYGLIRTIAQLIDAEIRPAFAHDHYILYEFECI